jgi:hypothetical protein
VSFDKRAREIRIKNKDQLEQIRREWLRIDKARDEVGLGKTTSTTKVRSANAAKEARSE